MKHFIIRYLNNRSDFYSTLFERCPQDVFKQELKSATSMFEESDEVLKQLEAIEDSLLENAIPSALLLDDLLKKPVVGQQLGRTVVSIRDVLKESERIESIGYLLFDTLYKQELTNKELWGDLAARRQQSLLNLLKLRDDLDFHRLKFP